MIIFALLFGAYLLGSIPFGVLVARRRGIDIMSVGSGNIGATNIFRTLGKGPGALVFLADTAKGAIPAAVATAVLKSPDWGLACGFAAVIGHSMSPWIGFRGGKGIATGLGALIGSYPMFAAIALSAFLLIWIPTGYVSLASILAACILTIAAFALTTSLWVHSSFVGLTLFIIVKHRANIKRLLEGTERKTVFGSKKPTT